MMGPLQRWALLVLMSGVAAVACTAAAIEPEPEPDPAPPPPDSVILVDAAHNNRHTLSTTYGGLGQLLRGDGWTVRPSDKSLNADLLSEAGLLIVSNALASQNVDIWREPIGPAFFTTEVEAVRAWVEGGGALLLVADHMPFPAAVANMAGAFGVELLNGFAFDPARHALPHWCLEPEQVQVFRRSDGTLSDHPITNGRNADERVDSVATFTGQAFDPEGVMQPLMTFGPNAVSIQPVEAWEFDQDTTMLPVDGWIQGGVMEYGAGRVAILGEAAMFTSQTCWRGGGFPERPMGWNAPAASQNERLAKNLVRWLLTGS